MAKKNAKKNKINEEIKKENIENNEKKAESKTDDNIKSKEELQKIENKEIEEVVAKEIKANKKLPKEELMKINTPIFINLILAIVIMLYLDFIVLGFEHIENSIFLVDLKVFSIAILVIAIGIFEYAYKKDSGKHAIYGIEILMLSFTTIAIIYTNIMWIDKFMYIVAFMAYVFAIYYVAKSIVIYVKKKREYFLNQVKEMIKK